MAGSDVYLFVYGTLLSDVPSAMSQYLNREGRLVSQVRLPGWLFDLGQYPGFVYDPNAPHSALGEIYKLSRPEQSLAILDTYEGINPDPYAVNEYARLKVAAPPEAGEEVTELFVYSYLGKTEGLRLIPDGDYRRYYPKSARHLSFIERGR